jgi:hypothetical protein
MENRILDEEMSKLAGMIDALQALLGWQSMLLHDMRKVISHPPTNRRRRRVTPSRTKLSGPRRPRE